MTPTNPPTPADDPTRANEPRPLTEAQRKSLPFDGGGVQR